eukprot:14763906-Alexandrium_andersonii.AAC.1
MSASLVGSEMCIRDSAPPFEALQLLLSDLATRRRGREYGCRRGARKALLADARRARLRAYVDEDWCAAPPP